MKFGKYLVIKSENFSNIMREADNNDLKNNYTKLLIKDGMVLVDEVVGKNHYKKACNKAKLLNEKDNPSKEKLELNNKLVAIWNRDSKCVSDDYFLSLSIKDMKEELNRLENIILGKVL